MPKEEPKKLSDDRFKIFQGANKQQNEERQKPAPSRGIQALSEKVNEKVDSNPYLGNTNVDKGLHRQFKERKKDLKKLSTTGLVASMRARLDKGVSGSAVPLNVKQKRTDLQY